MAKRLDIVEEKFLNTIKENNLIESEDKIVVGVSGGPDSITLLTCLNKYKEKFNCKIIVAHVNHLIRNDSIEDEQFVENYCEKNNIPIFIKRAKVEEIAKKKKRGTEEVGRQIRYDFFSKVLKENNANKIAIAHNMNDNAETMLLNLIRGTGLQGLEGIKPKNGNIIRPLINCKREEIECYCKKNNLNPRIDSTNSQNIYRRNIIRNRILPELKELNPNIVETLSRTSKIIRENDTYIKKIGEQIFNEIGTIESSNEISFKLKEFNKQNKALKSVLTVISITKLNGNFKNFEQQNIDDIIKLAENNIGNKHLLIKNFEFKIENSKLHIVRIATDLWLCIKRLTK